jgi:acyl-CoA thioester hydrolase
MHPAPDPGPARSVVRVRVRFYETDLMGIVHHGSYPAYLEVARVEWLRRRGVAYGDWTSRGMHLAVVELSLRYRTPARFDDELDVEATLGLVRAASMRFDYRVVRASDGALVAEGSTLLACVDEAGVPRRMRPEVAEVLLRAESPAAASWIAPGA